MTDPVRRVVTGFGPDGAGRVLFDGPAPAIVELPLEVGATLVDLWRSDTVPLATGDTFVHRGPRHAWVNRGTEPCRLVCTSIAATLPEGVEPG